ncbi:Exonuclease SbcC [Paraburkholderia tropica]|nr:Exonuclease SbcC [Paraburkholderia tropica]
MLRGMPLRARSLDANEAQSAILPRARLVGGAASQGAGGPREARHRAGARTRAAWRVTLAIAWQSTGHRPAFPALAGNRLKSAGAGGAVARRAEFDPI